MSFEDAVNPDEWFDLRAAELDRLEPVPDRVLLDLVLRDGACMDACARGELPVWSGDDMSDRELAARICAGCPVRDECLELEFRTTGDSGPGVWGALNEDDRREVYRAWLARRAALPNPTRHQDDEDEGWEGGDTP